MNYKSIHIGSCIQKVAEVRNLSVSRACIFLKCSHQDILDMYTQKALESDLLLRWCKLLDYNFFMMYHTHLQLYAPSASGTRFSKHIQPDQIEGFVFRKNIYSPDIIDWILNKLKKGELSPKDVMEKYHIPRTTIYRWKKRIQNAKDI